MAATLGAAFSIATALPQPFFGYLGDRFGRRTLAVGGMLVSAVFVSVIGFAPSYWALLGLLLVGGLGGAAFHPPGASYAVRLTAGKRRGRALFDLLVWRCGRVLGGATRGCGAGWVGRDGEALGRDAAGDRARTVLLLRPSQWAG